MKDVKRNAKIQVKIGAYSARVIANKCLLLRVLMTTALIVSSKVDNVLLCIGDDRLLLKL